MGRGTDLWDDSALINAFNDAVASYKAMHKESYPANPQEKEKDTSESNQDEVVPTESTTRQEELASGKNNVLKDVTQTCLPCHKDVATSEGLESQEENLVKMCTYESNSYLPEFPAVSAVTVETNYSQDQQTTDYNNLLKKFYDLEGQKQQVLWQLQQANYWYYQNPDQFGQAAQVLPNNASENFQQSPCSLCACLHSYAQLIPASACVPYSSPFGGFYCGPHFSGGQGHDRSGTASVGTSCALDPSKQTSDRDDKAIRMMATEKLSSSVKNQISRGSTTLKEKKGKKIIDEHKSSGDINQETDLADVLNAWYSAGFLTGRYLTEQSRRGAPQ